MLFWAYLTKVIPAYLTKVILSVPDEGYSSVPDEGYSSVPDEGYFERTWRRLFQKHVVCSKFDIYGVSLSLGQYLCWWIIRVPGANGIIRPVVGASALTWCIRYIYYRNLQFLNHVIIIKTKVLVPQA